MNGKTYTGTQIKEYSYATDSGSTYNRYRYEYDANGRITKIYWTNVGGESFILQKEYEYDAETGFYYCNSRYYDPQNARFVNADGQLCDDILGNNLFVYCANDPVNKFDPQGEAWWHWALGAAIVAVCAVATVVTCGGL